MADIYVALTTGAFTLSAALGGVYVTQRHVARQAIANRLEDRRAALRTIFADLIVQGDAHIDAAGVVLPAMTKMVDKDLFEYVDTDAAKDSQARIKALNRAITTSLLYVGDQELADAVRAFQADLQTWPEKAVAPVIDMSKTSEERFEGLGQSFAHLKQARQSLRHLEAEAAKVLRVPLTERRHRRWPRVRRWFRLPSQRDRAIEMS